MMEILIQVVRLLESFGIKNAGEEKHWAFIDGLIQEVNFE